MGRGRHTESAPHRLNRGRFRYRLLQPSVSKDNEFALEELTRPYWESTTAKEMHGKVETTISYNCLTTCSSAV